MSLDRSDSSEMGTNYVLLVASVPSLQPASVRHKGEALMIADAVKGDPYCDQVKCYEITTLKNQAFCFLKLADAFNNVDLSISAIPFPVSENRNNSVILWHRALLKIHPLVLVRFSVSKREHFMANLSPGFERYASE